MEIVFQNYNSEKHPIDYSLHNLPFLEDLPVELLSSKGFSGDLLFNCPVTDFNGGLINSLCLFYSLNTKNQIKAYFSVSESCFIVENPNNGRIAKFKPFSSAGFLEKKYFAPSDSFIISFQEGLRICFETNIEPYFFSNNSSESFSLSISFSFEGGNYGG